MMYAFGNRSDFAASDEPFYGAYLDKTGIDHPMRAEVLARHATDPAEIATRLAGPPPDGKPHWYQKHMAFHMLDGFPMGWAEGCTHVHLIRHPARVVASYAAKREQPTLNDIGFKQQLDLLKRFPGPVIDSADIRRDPERALRALCNAVGLGFDPAMLHWPAGAKPFDGIWAAHWYGAVHQSTGFSGAEGPVPNLDDAFAELAEQAMPYYTALCDHSARLSI